jgi:membrane-anchored glycerophosphoryl diester phosphodiesterase (GDPDase)
MNRGISSKNRPIFVEAAAKINPLIYMIKLFFVVYVILFLDTLRNEGRGDTYKNKRQKRQKYKIYMYINHLTCFGVFDNNPTKNKSAEIRHFGLNSGVHA